MAGCDVSLFSNIYFYFLTVYTKKSLKLYFLFKGWLTIYSSRIKEQDFFLFFIKNLEKVFGGFRERSPSWRLKDDFFKIWKTFSKSSL